MLSFQNSLNVAGKGELFENWLTGLSAAFNLGAMKNAQRRFEARASVGQFRSQDATACIITKKNGKKAYALRQTRAASPSADGLPIKEISLIALTRADALEGAFMEAVAADKISLT